jgi:hypothetical protein
VVGNFEYGKEPLVSVKGSEFRDKLSVKSSHPVQ